MFEFFGPKHDCEKLKDEMIAVLESKYKKKFLPIRLEPRGFQINYDELRFYPEGGDREEDEAHIAKFYEGRKQVSYVDNYFGIHIRAEHEAIIEKEARKIFDNVKVFSKFYADSFSDELTCENTLEDAIRLEENTDARIYVYIADQHMDAPFKEKVKELEKLLEKACIRGYYTIYHLKPGKLEGVNRKNCTNYVKKYTKYFDEICYEVVDENIPDSPIILK